MLRRFFWSLVVVCQFVALNGQVSVERTKSVVIKDNDNLQPVSYAAVANMRTGFCFQGDVNGNMKLSLAEGDTLLFRSMGYRDTSVVISYNDLMRDTIKVMVDVKPRMIKEVEVLAFRSYAAFKYMFANLKVEDKKSPLEMNFAINSREIAALSKAAAGSAGVSIGLGGLYGDSPQQKYKKFLAQENKMERVRNLTSHENLAEFTGLKDASLDSFVVFLRGNYTLTADLSDYQVMESVKNAFDQFLAMREGKGKN